MDTQKLWQATLGELELSLSKANFVTWFKNTFIVSYNDKKIIIGVPNTFTKAWFEKKYHSLILKALQKVTQNGFRELYYKVETKGPLSGSAQPAPITVKVDAPLSQNINELGLNSRYNFNNFVIGKANQLAHAASQAASQKPGQIYNPLFIYGGVGLGKTHLLQAIGNDVLARHQDKKVLYVSCEKFTNDFVKSIKSNTINKFKNIYRSVDVLLVDDIQFMAGKEGIQEEFFHTFNSLHQNNRQIVISSDRPPKAIPALENRLISRFEWGMIADVGSPDLETRIAILETKCQEKNLELASDVVNYIAANIKNNIRELEGALNRIIAYRQLNNIALTLEYVKQILESITASAQKKSVTPKQIINTVASYYDIHIDDIMGACRKKNLAIPRQIIMYLMREELRSSYPSIGQEIGNRDHTTAMHACLKINRELENDEKLKQDIDLLKERIYSL